MPTSEYEPNDTNCTGYKWTELVSGNQESKSPNDRGVTPTDTINDGVEMTSTEKNTVSTDDDNYVQAYQDGQSGYTARAAIMTQITISENEDQVTQLDQLCRACHIYAYHQVKFYIWDFDASTWVDLGDDIIGNTKDTHESTITTNPEKYIGSSIIYFLEWDYTGKYSGGGGCIVEGTQFKMQDGSLKNIEDLRNEDELKGWLPDRHVKTVVKKWKDEGLKEWQVYTVKGADFQFSLTKSHYVATNWGVRMVEDLDPNRDKLLRIANGKMQLFDIVSVERKQVRCKVYNFLSTPTENYILANGILIHNREKMWA